ncbi:hypothetical protein EVAR_56041_1 [Eumeta japonica]|uniref:Uncharacterized protein n=1 Tax=Eumeta variegata TaxID=151549 RepID=A0A4C1YC28_EUMVA|nr:hypothetical protein EVAR_56041_1 [Eumeta japonica]
MEADLSMSFKQKLMSVVILHHTYLRLSELIFGRIPEILTRSLTKTMERNGYVVGKLTLPILSHIADVEPKAATPKWVQTGMCVARRAIREPNYSPINEPPQTSDGGLADREFCSFNT